MPHIHKIFKHSWSKTPKVSKTKMLYRNRNGSSWRRFFGKSWKSEASDSQRLFEGNVCQPVAPHIETLKLTRASLSSLETDPPRLPPSSYSKEFVTGNALSRPSFEEQRLPEKTESLRSAMSNGESMNAPDIERRIQAPLRSWQEYNYTLEDRTNETRRAQYDL